MYDVGINELHGHAVYNTLQQINAAKDVSIVTLVAAVGSYYMDDTNPILSMSR